MIHFLGLGILLPAQNWVLWVFSKEVGEVIVGPMGMLQFLALRFQRFKLFISAFMQEKKEVGTYFSHFSPSLL